MRPKYQRCEKRPHRTYSEMSALVRSHKLVLIVRRRRKLCCRKVYFLRLRLCSSSGSTGLPNSPPETPTPTPYPQLPAAPFISHSSFSRHSQGYSTNYRQVATAWTDPPRQPAPFLGGGRCCLSLSLQQQEVQQQQKQKIKEINK